MRRDYLENKSYRDVMMNVGYEPAGIELQWCGAQGDVVIKVNECGGKEIFSTNVSGMASLEITNLKINFKYVWSVRDASGVAEGMFFTEDIAPRLVKVPGIPNLRDFGGRIALAGKRVKQGMIYRSGGLNGNAYSAPAEDSAADNASTNVVKMQKMPGKERLTEQTRSYMKTVMGIKTDLDLRSDGECFGMTASPLGRDVKWVKISSADYAKMSSDFGRDAFAKVFRVFLDEANYPIDVHCISGADRTGAVAFILNGLLGVSEEELYRDWEFTAFSTPVASFTHKERFDKLVSVFAEYPGETLCERIESYVLSLGFTKSDIAKFRSIMLI